MKNKFSIQVTRNSLDIVWIVGGLTVLHCFFLTKPVTEPSGVAMEEESYLVEIVIGVVVGIIILIIAVIVIVIFVR